jgi:multidrug efflux pump
LTNANSASEVIRRLQPELAQVAGITLFMQAVQDITVEDRVSRTQFNTARIQRRGIDVFAPRMLEN